MNNPKNLTLSIITVCLNADKSIEKSINSVISQKTHEIEYIIIDGDSSDATKTILNKYRDNIDVIISEKDEGIYNAMNKGVNIATGDYVYFLGADDILIENILIKIMPILKSDNDVIHYGQVILQPDNKLYGGKFNKWRLIHKNISHQAIFYPKKVFSEKRFNEKYKILADWDLNLYLISKNYKFIYNGLIISNFKRDGISSYGDKIFLKDFRKIIKNYFGIKESLYLIFIIKTPILIINFIVTKFYKLKNLKFRI